MARNAGILSCSSFFWSIVIIFIIIYNQAYRLLKWALLVGLIYALALSSFPEVEHRQIMHLNAVEKNSSSSSEVRESPKVGSLFDSYPEAAKEISEIVDMLMRDFIMSWFQHIDGNSSSKFPQIVKNVILETICKLHEYLYKVDETDLIVLKLLPLLTKYFNSFCTAREAVLRDISLGKYGTSNISLQMAVEFNRRHKLHSSLSLRLSCLPEDIGNHIKNHVSKLLPYIVDEVELKSPYVSILLREILSMSIIVPTLVKFSEPDNWNILLVSMSEKILEEHDQVLEVRRILSKEIQFQRLHSKQSTEYNHLMEMKFEFSDDYSDKKFEDYLRLISLLDSPYHLMAVRHSLLSQVLLLNIKQLSTSGTQEQKKRISLSAKLIHTRLCYVDSKNKVKSHTGFGRLTSSYRNLDQALEEFSSSLQVISFDDITEQACLPYFEQYLQSHCNEYGISYLKFYELVEKMKTPLEDSRDITITYPPSEIDDLRKMIEEFGSLADLKVLDPGLVSNIQLFVSRANPKDDQTVMLARRSMLLLQNEAKKALSEDFFENFKNSKYFLKMVSDVNFIDTDVYSKLLDFPEIVSRKPIGVECRSSRSIPRLHIDDALDTILKSTKKSGRHFDNHYANNKSLLFGDGDIDNALFKDSLFNDDLNNDSGNESIENSDDDSLSDRSVSKEIQLPNLSATKVESTFANLQVEIDELTIAIDQIEKELGLLDHLILKAELTNNQTQLRLLRKSQRALMRDLENKGLLKRQYLVQEDANSLFRKTKICIKSYYVDQRFKSPREVIYYLINVNHINKGQVTTWEIPRRFSEFHSLNMELRRKYKHSVKHLQRKDIFPEKVKISLKYHVSKSLLYEERKSKLEKYLRELLSISEICQDSKFRRFLTNTARFTGRTDADAEQNDPSDLESSTPSLIPTSHSPLNIIPEAGFQTHEIGFQDDDEVKYYENFHDLHANSDATSYQEKSYVKSICDFFISIFGLNKNNSGWLRGRAVLTVLQQLLGSAIDKYIKENLKRMTSESQMTDILRGVKTLLWSPHGVLATKKLQKEPRTAGDMRKSKLDSQLLLQRLFSEVCGKVVGFRNAQNAAMNIHEMLQNPYLNANLLLEILDLTLNEIFFNESVAPQKKFDGE